MPILRPTPLLALTALGFCGVGCRNGNVTIVICDADSADYQFDGATVAGPPVIPNGGSASYTVTWSATVRAPGGTVCPAGELVDDDGFLRFDGDVLDDFAPLLGATATVGPRSGSAAVTLRCVDGEVVGTNAGSGEGSRPAFFLPVDEAEVVAIVSRRDGSASARSAPLDVECS